MAASEFRADSANLTGSILQTPEHRFGYYYGSADLASAPALVSGVHLPFGYVNTERSGVSDEVTYVAPMSGSLDKLMIRFLSGALSPAIAPSAGSITSVIGPISASIKSTNGRLTTTGNVAEEVISEAAISFDSGLLIAFSGSNHFNPGAHIAIRFASNNDLPSSNTLCMLYTSVFRYKID